MTPVFLTGFGEFRIGASYDVNTSTLKPASNSRGGVSFPRSYIEILDPNMKKLNCPEVLIPDFITIWNACRGILFPVVRKRWLFYELLFRNWQLHETVIHQPATFWVLLAITGES